MTAGPKILAIETSGQSGSVALCAAGQIVAQRQLDPQARSARVLAPAMQEILRHQGWQPRQIDVVAVAVGPGSFTGLRVGVTTAKTFAYAVGAKVVAINTLDVIAAGVHDAPPQVQRLLVGLDAQRGDVFAAQYGRTGQQPWQRVALAEIMTSAAWLALAGEDCGLAGPVLTKLVGSNQGDVLSTNAWLAPREQWEPQATAVAQLAAERAVANAFDDLWTLAPLYLRRSAAEEKLLGE